jgi:hypothetical protein
MRGYVYRIFCKNENIIDCYIGSTFNYNVRRSAHKAKARDINNKLLLYEFIRNHGGMENFNFEILEEADFETKEDLLKRENHHFNLINPTLNQNKPFIEDYKLYQKQYYKEKYTDYHRKRYNENKDEYKATNKRNYEKLKNYKLELEKLKAEMSIKHKLEFEIDLEN